MSTIWIPQTRAEAIEIANLLTNNNTQAAYELILMHAAFGHAFNFDMGLVYINCICIKGKPTMRADALAGAAHNSGLVDYMTVTEFTEQACTIECKRKGSDVIHKYSFTMEMAKSMNLTRNQSWQRMPKQMLKARCTALACRAVFPDAVSGMYTADEIADHTDLSEAEKFKITAESLGEDDLKYSSRAPAPVPPPQPSNPPAPKPSAPPAQQPAPKGEHRSMYDFSSESAFWLVVDEHNIDRAQVNGVLKRYMHDVSIMTPIELENVFYECVVHATIRNSNVNLDSWWARTEQQVNAVHKSFVAEYPALSMLTPEFYGARISQPAFAETLSHVCILKDDEIRSIGLDVLNKMHPRDWSAYDYVLSLTDNS